MNTADIRSLILSSQLQEEKVSLAAWPDANLVIRELSGKAGAALISSVTDASGKIDQDSLVPGIILQTLRNADDPNKALIFGKPDVDEPDPAFKDALMSIGLGKIMSIANASIKLSGLNESIAVDEAKNALPRTPGANLPTG